jgi:hypothetical protein
VISAAAAKNRELIAKHYTGIVKDRTGKVRSKAALIIALMPTTRLREVASILEEVYGKEIVHLTDLALNLHEFQYNGLDSEGVVSRYTNLSDVEKDIALSAPASAAGPRSHSGASLLESRHGIPELRRPRGAACPGHAETGCRQRGGLGRPPALRCGEAVT